MNTGDGRYGWRYRVITGSVLRLILSEADCRGSAIEYSEEVHDVVCPAFFANQKYADREPINLKLPNGQTTRLPLDFLGEGHWGTKGSPEFWKWFKSMRAKPGDALIFRVLDGEARRYGIEFEPHAAREESAIGVRNEQVVQAALAHFRRSASGVADWDMSTHLLAIGSYQDPVPPDPLKEVWTRDLWEPELAKKPVRGGWVRVGRDDSELMVASLMEQLHDWIPHSKMKREPVPMAEIAAPNSIYQLKVTLKDGHPAIWRRIQVGDNILLPHLHGVLQLAMGWKNSHLHSFQVGNQTFAEPSADDYLPVVDYRTVRLNQIAPAVKDRFIYLYDFGDSWEHEIVVEKILSIQKDTQYPRCIDGKRACPPEDVGGVWGYADFVKAIRSPRHPEHDEMLGWVGGKFDPDQFDLPGVNGKLRIFQSTLAFQARKK